MLKGFVRLCAVLGVIVTTAGAAVAQTLPSGWATLDIGAVGAAGSASGTTAAMTAAGAGADIWGTADAFRFVYTPLTGDGSVVTQVVAEDRIADWTKAGVMMRETLTPGSRQALMLVSPAKGLAFQRRESTGATSINVAGGSGAAPYYVKLTRAGNTFTAARSLDGVTWTTVGSASISMGATIYAGVAVSSHVAGIVANASFASTAVTASGTAPAQTLPAGWATSDIGSVGAAGTATGTATTLLAKGGGADIWAAADAFRYAYQPITGDGSIVTQVTSLQTVDAWTKAGVMMRETLAANAPHASMFVSPSKGLAFQRRATAGGLSVSTPGALDAAPYFVKLTRAGNTFTAYQSIDGATWTTVGSTTIVMSPTIYVGVAVTSHVAGRVATASFGGTTVTVTPPPPSTPDPGAGGGTVTAPPGGGVTVPPPPPAGSAITVRVLHWNLHHGNDPNNVYALARQMDVIGGINPDVISLNEVEKFNSSYGNEDQAAHLAQYLTERTGQQWYQFMAPGNGDSTGIGNAILSRFPFVTTDVCQLSTMRNAVHATMMINGRTFNMWSTHLEVETAAARITETTALTTCMNAFAEPRLVAGDFNAGTGTTEINNMTAGYIDAWPAATALRTALNFAGNCDGCTRNSRIDYGFSSKAATMMTLKSAQIFDTRDAGGVMASDHKPMLLIYEVQ